MKKLVVLVLVLTFAIVGCKKEEKAGVPVVPVASVQVADIDFGATTLALVDKGEYVISCDDSKKLLSMINAVGSDFATNPEANTTDNMTPAMKEFELEMDSFGDALETRFEDEAKLGEVLDKLGADLSKVFQVSIMQSVGMIDEAGVNTYIDVMFCGATPPAGYVDPLVKMEQELANSAAADNATQK